MKLLLLSIGRNLFTEAFWEILSHQAMGLDTIQDFLIVYQSQKYESVCNFSNQQIWVIKINMSAEVLRLLRHSKADKEAVKERKLERNFRSRDKSTIHPLKGDIVNRLFWLSNKINFWLANRLYS